MSPEVTNLVYYPLYIMTEIQDPDVKGSQTVKTDVTKAMYFIYSHETSLGVV